MFENPDRVRAVAWFRLSFFVAAFMSLPRTATADLVDTELPVVHGKGLRFGNSNRFHPGAAFLLGYDTNVFRTRAPNPVRRAWFGLGSAWMVLESRAMRGGRLDVPLHGNDNKIEYHMGVVAGFRFYMTPQEVVKDEGAKFNIGARARFVFAPGRVVSGFLTEDFYRRGETPKFEGGAPFYHLNRKEQNATLGLRIRPGGGRLTLESAGVNEILRYDSDKVWTSDRVTTGIRSEVKWRFVDRSALVLRHEYVYNWYNWYNRFVSETGLNHDSHDHEFTGGFVGQIGRYFNVEAVGGYRQMRFVWDRAGPDFEGFVFDAVVAAYPIDGMSIRLAGRRRARNSILGNYYVDLGGDLRFEYAMKFGLRVDATASLIRRAFHGLPIPMVEATGIASYRGAESKGARGFVRTDDLLELSLDLQQTIGPVFVVGLTYRFMNVRSDFAAVYDPRIYGDRVEYGAFRRHFVVLTTAVRY